ncbi:MFS general substrate transporter [Violaceomyces palustris]|uniref:MFS general substrate transporter n=1 Tax=Violaceomyces palustris TaxID=1673888 RepID=A0ACD0NXD5_9BASI|nr:MFS general substrate transporter [Violaceomyces palustris]
MKKESPPSVVELQGQENPLNWSSRKKWTCVMIVSWAGFLSPLASSIIAPAVGILVRDLGVTSHSVSVLPVSMYVLGLGFGPFVLSPTSEAVGRRWVYVFTGLVFVLFNLGSALCDSIASLSVLRLLSGIMGSTGPCLGAASIADMFSPAERGRAVSVYAVGPILGPSLGNMLGAWIAERTSSWQWPLRVVTIASASVPLLCYLLPETYAPVLLQRKKADLLGSQASKVPLSKTLKDIQIACKRPFKLMFTNPVCTIFALYQAYMYGILYLAFTTFPLIFTRLSAVPGLKNYGWSIGISGLAYIPLALGSVTATLLNYFFANRSYLWLVRRNQSRREASGLEDKERMQQPEKEGGGGAKPPVTRPKGKPEYRLPFSCLAILILAVGLFWFGWSSESGNLWVVPMFGIYLIGVGATLTFQCLQIYLVDAFIPYSASAIAVSVLLRSILGAVFPLFGERLYRSCGYGWGNSILGFATLAVLPISLSMLQWGEKVRERFKFRG